MTDPTERFLLQALPFESALRTYLRTCTRNTDDTADLLQQTYARLWGAGKADTTVVRSIRAFAFTIAERVAQDIARARRRKDPAAIPVDPLTADDALASSTAPSPVEREVGAQQEIDLLSAFLANLPPRAREVFTLRKVYGCSQAEIAGLLGIAEHTLESHIATAARRCADFLCAQPGGPRQYSVLEGLMPRRRRTGST